MFGLAQTDHDFASVHSEVVSQPPRSKLHESFTSLRSSVTSLLDPANSLQQSISILSTANVLLSDLRNRTSLTSVTVRPLAVTLMAQEAILWSTVETLACSFSHRNLPETKRSSGLGLVNATLWEMLDSRVVSKKLDTTTILPGHSYDVILELPPASRSARTDFERQRNIYSGLLTFLSQAMGVDDHREHRLRAWLVWLVVDVLGFDALYHVEVWKGWQYPQARCITGRLWTKQPSLDCMLPLIKTLCDTSTLNSHPPSALAALALGALPAQDAECAVHTSRQFAEALKDVYAWKPAIPVIRDPPNAILIRRSLALAGELIGTPHQLSHL